MAHICGMYGDSSVYVWRLAFACSPLIFSMYGDSLCCVLSGDVVCISSMFGIYCDCSLYVWIIAFVCMAHMLLFYGGYIWQLL